MGRKSLQVHVNGESRYRRLLLSDLLAECGRGVFIQKTGQVRPDDFDYSPCPFCGAHDYIAFLDNEWDGNESSPDDIFECFVCEATHTRRDAFGGYDTKTWDKDKEEVIIAPIMGRM